MRPMRVFERERESSTIPQSRGFDAFPLNPYLIVSTINHAFTREFAYPFSSFSTLSPCIRITICPPLQLQSIFHGICNRSYSSPMYKQKNNTIQSRSCSSNFLFTGASKQHFLNRRGSSPSKFEESGCRGITMIA